MSNDVQQDAQPAHVEARARRSLTRGLVLLVVAAIGTVCFVAIALRVVEGHADTFDRQWSLAIHDIDTEQLDIVMIAFTTIGSGPCLYASIALVSLLAWRRRLWPLAIILLANALVALLTNTLLKLWFVRARPTLFDEITRPETFSFPSGHAMSAMAVYGGTAAVLIGLYPTHRWLIVVTATILIAGVGFSRVYLGVHWPLDVLAGYTASVPFVVATVHIVHRLLQRHAKRHERV
jgi:membrane-associated phospholipid phosphatase